MADPLFWLGLSIVLVAVSLTAVLVAALPTLRELARAARSAEKLFDTLSRELPPTLEAIRLTGLEITDLTDDVSDGVQSANRVVKQVDQSLRGVRKQAKKAQVSTRSLWVGVKTAWKTFQRPSPSARRIDRLPSGNAATEFEASSAEPEIVEYYSSDLSYRQSYEDRYEDYDDDDMSDYDASDAPTDYPSSPRRQSSNQ